MDLKIINKKEEPLLSRTRVEAEIVFEKSTPSREEIKSKLAKDVGKDEKLVIVKSIYTKYGLKKATNLSYVYENEESLKRIEPKTKEKTGKKKEEKSEEKPQEQAKKEAKEDTGKQVSGTNSVGKKPEVKEESKKESKPEQKEAKAEEKPKK
jgi:ribosomal protein S24E